MNFQAEYPEFFEKKVVIALTRLKINKIEKINNIAHPSDSRVTRSKRRENNVIEWVRILNGFYKNDIAFVESMNESEANVKLFPRINYSSIQSNGEQDGVCKRRPLQRAFDIDEIR